MIDENGCRLRQLFAEFVKLCKLVQYLDALFCKGYLKHKRESHRKLEVLSGIPIKQLGFCCEWRGEDVVEPFPYVRAPKGVLLYALLESNGNA